MKNRMRIITSVLLTFAILLGTFSQFAVYAAPIIVGALTESDAPAETVWVGNVELSAGWYVLNGSSYAEEGEPADDATGYAYYMANGVLLLNGYTYEGTGKTHDTSEKSAIYSAGSLQVVLVGKNEITNTADSGIWSANGIRAKGKMIISGAGSITLNAPYAIYCDSLVQIDYGKIVIPSASLAIEAGGDLVINGGVIHMNSSLPVFSTAVYINGGSFVATATQGVFKTAPTLPSNMESYTLTVSRNQDGSSPQEYSASNITRYKYFSLTLPEREAIDIVSIADVVLPELGQTSSAVSFEEATFGASYGYSDWKLQSYVGDTWQNVDAAAAIGAEIQYRIVVWLEPYDGYTFSSDTTDDDVSFNGDAATVYELAENPDFYALAIAYEFSYKTPVTDYMITVAAKDGEDTVGVKITSENCDDVLGDGTVCYDPATRTLTLDGYVYEGDGISAEGNYAIFICGTEETYTVELKGENRISLNTDNGLGIILPNSGSLIIKGDGSLDITTKMYGIVTTGEESYIEIQKGVVKVGVTNSSGAGLMAASGVIVSGGTVNITSLGSGIMLYFDDGEIKVTGGTLEVSVATEGKAFTHLGEDMISVTHAPDFSSYVGEIKAVASTSADGLGAVKYNEDDLSAYKYVKIKKLGTYVISFLGNGGLGTMDDVSVKEDELFELPECTFTAPTSTRFKGWAIGSLGGVQKQPGDKISVNENTSVYAVWEKLTYYSVSGGSGTGYYVIGSTVTIVADEPEEGYAFDYWDYGDGFSPRFLDGTSKYTPTAKFVATDSGARIYACYKDLSYGISVGATVEGEPVMVKITPENCEDVLGDGTVSFDPETCTLTLNGYQFKGDFPGIYTEHPYDSLNIVLKGNNKIETYDGAPGIAIYRVGNISIGGTGSLSIDSDETGMLLFAEAEMVGGTIKINAELCGINTNAFVMSDGGLEINVTGEDVPAGIAAEFVAIEGGEVKISSQCFGIILMEEYPVILAGGVLEISTAIKGYAFVNSDYDFSEITPSVPDTTGCMGKYMMVASYDSEGGYATTYDPSASEYYKYVKFVYGVYDSGITVAQNVDDRVVCVNITSENFMDVFGDGTVSFDPDTYTLTLNGYQFKGDFYSIYSMLPHDSLNIVLKGNNKIETSYDGTAILIERVGQVTIGGTGSLSIDGCGICVSDALFIIGGNITINAPYAIDADTFVMSNGKVTINTVGEYNISVSVSNNFGMVGGSLKITSDSVGVGIWNYDADSLCITGGSLEVSSAVAGYAIAAFDYEIEDFFPIPLDLSEYEGEYSLIASANSDGSGSVDYNVEDVDTYKYIKLQQIITAVPGDVNGDELVTNADVLMIYRYIYNSTLYPIDVEVADVNNDGLVTNADVLNIYRYIYNPTLYPLG